MARRYIIIGMTVEKKVVAIGDDKAHIFPSEKSADKIIKRLEIHRPDYDYLVLEIQVGPKKQ